MKEKNLSWNTEYYSRTRSTIQNTEHYWKTEYYSGTRSTILKTEHYRDTDYYLNAEFLSGTLRTGQPVLKEEWEDHYPATEAAH